jgi:hypothetical protein
LHFVVSAISEFALPARETARKQAIFVAAEEKKERIAGYSGEYCAAGSLLNKNAHGTSVKTRLIAAALKGRYLKWAGDYYTRASRKAYMKATMTART